MPYINIESQNKFKELETVLATIEFDNAGGLNYVISQIAIHYLLKKGIKYQTMNDIVGAFDGAKVEFQRRIVAPYETQKAFDNGDLYERVVL
jgi:hypothetical protein